MEALGITDLVITEMKGQAVMASSFNVTTKFMST